MFVVELQCDLYLRVEGEIWWCTGSRGGYCNTAVLAPFVVWWKFELVALFLKLYSFLALCFII